MMARAETQIQGPLSDLSAVENRDLRLGRRLPSKHLPRTPRRATSPSLWPLKSTSHGTPGSLANRVTDFARLLCFSSSLKIRQVPGHTSRQLEARWHTKALQLRAGEGHSWNNSCAKSAFVCAPIYHRSLTSNSFETSQSISALTSELLAESDSRPFRR